MAKCFADVSSPLMLHQKARHANTAKECESFELSLLMGVCFIQLVVRATHESGVV